MRLLLPFAFADGHAVLAVAVGADLLIGFAGQEILVLLLVELVLVAVKAGGLDLVFGVHDLGGGAVAA